MVKNLLANIGDVVSTPGQEDPLEEEMSIHSSILAGKIHGQRSLLDCSPWGCKGLDTTEQLSTYA